jgi:replicative DNA helicase
MKKDIQLDFEFYEKIIIYNSLLDSEYLESILDHVKPSFFKNEDIKIVFGGLCEYYSSFNKVPNLTEFKAHLNLDQKKSLKNVALSFSDLDKTFDKEVLLKNTERFIKERAVLETVIKTSIEAQSGNIDSQKILADFEKVCNISLIQTNGFDYLENIDQHCEDLQKVFKTISTGWKWLDERIGGGFQSSGRALYVFYGVTNVGKSIFLGNIATNILSQDKTVVLISLEMSEQIYAKRISAQLSQIAMNELHIHIDPLKNELLKYKNNHKNAKLIIKEFPPKSVSPVQIKTYINKLVKMGIKPDAIVLDYLNLMSPVDKGLNSYEGIKQITELVRAMSYCFECPVITATQTNRSAYNEANPGLETTSESMGLAHTADAQFSIWSEQEDIELGIIHLGITKNRFGPRDCHTVLEIDYPTLSLKDPDNTSKNYISHSSERKSVSNTLQMLENLNEEE